MEDERAGTAGPARDAAAVIGVLGAGTMGAGIAQLACSLGSADAAVRPDRARRCSAGSQSARDGPCRRKPRAAA